MRTPPLMTRSDAPIPPFGQDAPHERFRRPSSTSTWSCARGPMCTPQAGPPVARCWRSPTRRSKPVAVSSSSPRCAPAVTSPAHPTSAPACWPTSVRELAPPNHDPVAVPGTAVHMDPRRDARQTGPTDRTPRHRRGRFDRPLQPGPRRRNREDHQRRAIAPRLPPLDLTERPDGQLCFTSTTTGFTYLSHTQLR